MDDCLLGDIWPGPPSLVRKSGSKIEYANGTAGVTSMRVVDLFDRGLSKQVVGSNGPLPAYLPECPAAPANKVQHQR
jgi:hypothetical protein